MLFHSKIYFQCISVLLKIRFFHVNRLNGCKVVIFYCIIRRALQQKLWLCCWYIFNWKQSKKAKILECKMVCCCLLCLNLSQQPSNLAKYKNIHDWKNSIFTGDVAQWGCCQRGIKDSILICTCDYFVGVRFHALSVTQWQLHGRCSVSRLRAIRPSVTFGPSVER